MSRWLLWFLVAALVLPPVPFAFGDSGAHPSLAIAAVGLGVAALRFDEWRLRIEGVGVALLLYTAVLAASVGMALLDSSPAVAAGSAMRVALFGISVFVFFSAACGPGAEGVDEKQFTRILFWAAVVSALFACVDFAFQLPPPAGYGRQFLWLTTGTYRRAQGVFYEASTLGNVCAFFLIMIAVELVRPQRLMARKWLLVGGVAIAAALVLSYSRSSLGNFAVAMAALGYLRRGRIRWGRVAGWAAIAAGLVVAVTAAVFPVFSALYWERVFGSFRYFAESPNAILSGRLSSWSYLLGFLANHPLYWVLGVGYKTVAYSGFVGKKVIADNAYLSALVETGVVGLAAVLGLCAAILKAARRAAESEDARASFFGTWMFCFWCGEMAQMLSGDLLTFWRVLPVYFWVLAMAVRER
jgi:O-antigen ligase